MLRRRLPVCSILPSAVWRRSCHGLPPSPSLLHARTPSAEPLLPVHGVHAFACPDQVGITAKITECIAKRGASIHHVDVYVSFDVRNEPAFFARTEFAFDPLQWPRKSMNEDFLSLKKAFNAKKSITRVFDIDPPLKVAVLVSRQDHCLVDLLHQWEEGKLPVQIECIIRWYLHSIASWSLTHKIGLRAALYFGHICSNHKKEDNTHVTRFLNRHNIPYHYLPANKEDRKEEDILGLITNTDFLVLARYMQILSPEFLKGYGKDIINIHHGLLPSFKGANPYKQAYQAGVKLIGATTHFVTEELDCGPIIEQMVERVSHRDTLATFAMKSEYLEKACLAKAIKYYCELRIMRYSGNRTIVFD